MTTALLARAIVAAPSSYAGAAEHAQRRLNLLGCQAGPADGRIGPHTRSAVFRFQSASGLRMWDFATVGTPVVVR
jgi:peptidoglycan hydrolase-like protein with peptidoglycan-binding domain